MLDAVYIPAVLVILAAIVLIAKAADRWGGWVIGFALLLAVVKVAASMAFHVGR